MPLSVRRRHKVHKGKPNPSPPPFPRWESPLEQLPAELLLPIFLESQNRDFVFTSKSIYHKIGHNPRQSEMMAFFLHRLARTYLLVNRD